VGVLLLDGGRSDARVDRAPADAGSRLCESGPGVKWASAVVCLGAAAGVVCSSSAHVSIAPRWGLGEMGGSLRRRVSKPGRATWGILQSGPCSGKRLPSQVQHVCVRSVAAEPFGARQ
jgi:hypothetical protein